MDTSEDSLPPRQGAASVPEVYTVLLVVITFVLPGAMMVMCIENLVFFDTYHHTLVSVDWYEVILLMLSLVALVWLLVTFRRYAECSDDTRFLTLCGSDRGFFILICVFAVGSLLTPVFKVVATAMCFRKDVGITEVVVFILNVLKAVFLIGQTLFLVFSKDYRCTTKLSMCSVMILVSTNVSLCIRCFSDAVKQTMLNNRYSISARTAYGAAFCSSQGNATTEGFRVIDKYFYTMVLFYCLYSINVLCSMWNLVGSRGTSIQAAVEESLGTISSEIVGNTVSISLSQHSSIDRSNSTLLFRTWARIKSIYCVGLCKYSFLPTGIACLTLLLAHIILDVKMKEFDPPKNGTTLHKDTAFVWIQTVYENFMTGAAFVGLIFVFKRKLNPNKLYAKHILLLVATCVFAVLISLESFDAIANMVHHPRTEDICLFLFRTLFHFLGLLFQTPFVIKSSYLPNLQPDTNRYTYIRGLLWFLAITNLERSLVDTFLTPIVLRYATNIPDDFFSRDNWAMATRVVFPGVAVYRLQSSLLCFENLRNMGAGMAQGLQINTRRYENLVEDVNT